MSQDTLAEQKKIIDDLIVKLLNDPDEEPSIYNKSNVRSLFTVLLESRNANLCQYTEDEFYQNY